MAKRITLGDSLPVKAYQHCGATIRPNLHSAPWRRIWWVCDGPVEMFKKLREAAGIEADYLYEPVPFRSLAAACSAIAKATGQ